MIMGSLMVRFALKSNVILGFVELDVFLESVEATKGRASDRSERRFILNLVLKLERCGFVGDSVTCRVEGNTIYSLFFPASWFFAFAPQHVAGFLLG